MPSDYEETLPPDKTEQVTVRAPSRPKVGDVGERSMRGTDEPLEEEPKHERKAALEESKPSETEKTIPPVNELGEKYPEVIDLRTGEPIPFPEGKLEIVQQDQRVPWGKRQRDEFIEEWERRGHPIPKGGWSKYDIHHIHPREYGGTNNFENLTPVLRKTHQTVITSWWSHYKPA